MEVTAQVFDVKAKALASDYLRTEGELLTILMEMRKRRLFPVLNYQGIFDYCLRALNFSRAQAYYFKSVAEKSEEVPEIRAAIAHGDITLSQARRIVSVVTPENHQDWIAKAKTLPQLQLEREVNEVNPKARIRERIQPIAPALSEMRVPIDHQTEEGLSVLRDILSQKKGRSVSLSEAVAWAVEVTRDRFDPVRRADRAKPVSSGNEVPASPGRHPIPAAVRHAVMTRDKGRCTYVSRDGRRCETKRWLQMHHIVEVSRGGLNTSENLRLFCQAHHALTHSSPKPPERFLTQRS